MTADQILAAQARPREQLLAALAAAELNAMDAAQPRPWRVFRQAGHEPEQQVCWHRLEWVAERCARRREARHDGLGVRYTVRRTGGDQ